jgi:hypothetical protein
MTVRRPVATTTEQPIPGVNEGQPAVLHLIVAQMAICLLCRVESGIGRRYAFQGSPWEAPGAASAYLR